MVSLFGTNAKPNGVMPDEAWTVGPVGMPTETLYVSMLLVFFSVTTKTRPLPSNEISAGPTPVPLRGALELGIARSLPLRVMRKPEIELLPSLRTKSKPRRTARLIGCVPREATLSTNCRPPGTTRKLVISLLPASTAKRKRLSSLVAIDPWTVPAIDGSPRPPVSNDWSYWRPPSRAT